MPILSVAAAGTQNVAPELYSFNNMKFVLLFERFAYKQRGIKVYSYNTYTYGLNYFSIESLLLKHSILFATKNL